jgi:nucleoside-diphosphate-sugar epimerase
MRLAITGGTGFVGSHLIEQAVAQGHEVTALTRRVQPAACGVRWIEGALDQHEALLRLASGADAIIHVAGVINGDAAAFHAGNVLGTEAMVAAAAQADVGRFIHISSLAAREPALSAYGASKARAEEPVIAAGGDWTIIRPPAIYGPRDRELFELFRIAKKVGIVPVPAATRLSVIHVTDLCSLILACLHGMASHTRTFEPDDGRPGGWPARLFARAVGGAVGRSVAVLPLARRLLLAGSAVDRAVRGDKAKLTRDRVDYFTHPDWTAAPHAQPPADLWRPRIRTEEGLADTARWYLDAGWL